MSRFAAVTVLAATLGLMCSSALAQDYITQTVPPTAPYMHELEKVYELGIIEGYRDATFRPDQHVERAELWVAFNRLVDVCRTRGMQLPVDYRPYEATYGRGFRDHWGMEAWERLIKTYLADDRPLPIMMDYDGNIKRIEFAELAVAVLRAYGVVPYDMTPAEIAIGDSIMVRQPDGQFHFQSGMPRWELAVCMSRLLDTIAPAQ
ncbi:MAG: S-layer homology domain-containing protein [Armatimonadota bacterium]